MLSVTIFNTLSAFSQLGKTQGEETSPIKLAEE